MADASLTQPSFTAGEIAPALYARKDLARYQVGARKMTNMFVHAHGGASNRAGLKFAAEVPDSAKTTRITTFEAASDEAFLLVWGDEVLRPMFRGAYLDAGGGVPYEITTPYPSPDLAKLYMEQSNDVSTVVHPLHLIRELARYDNLDWRITQVAFASQVPAPEVITAVGTEGYTGYNSSHLPKFYTYKVSSVGMSGEESLPSSPSTSDIALVLGFEQNFVTLTWSPPGAGYAGSSPPGALLGAGGFSYYNRGFSLPNDRTISKLGVWSISAISGIVVRVAERTSPGNYTPVATVTFNHPGGGWHDADLAVPYVVPASGVFYVGTYSTVSIRASTGPAGYQSGNFTGPSGGFSEGNTRPPSVRAFLEGEDSDVVVDSYNIYKEENGLFGYIGRTYDTTFKDTNFTPSFSQGPQSGENPFVGDGNYPSVVTFCQQRRVFANTINQPQTVFETQSANYNNMGTATPIRDDDAITFTLASKKKQDVYHVVALDKGMIVFTRSGEWKVTGRDGDVITPSSVFPSPQSAYGADRALKPLIVGEQMLFVKHAGRNVLELGFSLEADRYVANDLTILSNHLFEGRNVVAWDYAAAPYSVIWCVMSDGKALSLTYMKEHDVWGWGRHETSGKFLDVSVVPEDTRDVPYFLVRRRIGGVSKQFIEYMADREFTDIKDAFFVDSGLSLDNPIEITAIALGATTTCTSAAHGLVNGDTIELDGVYIIDDNEDVVMTLDGRWIVAGATANTFRLTYEYDNIDALPPITAGDDLDTTDVAGGYYDGDGVFRKGFLSVGGLDHLEGREVVILADGSVVEGETVVGGSVMPDPDVKHFRAHVGLSFQAVLGTLDLYNSQGDDTGITKGVPTVFARLLKSRGLKFGRLEDDVSEEVYTRDDEDYDDPAELQNGLYKVELWEDWVPDQSLFIVQDYPLPMTVLGITLKVMYGGD